MTPTLIPERLEQLDHILLKHGAHHTVDDGACAMEVVSWLAGEEHSDHPTCVSPILGDFLRSWNDILDEEGRQKLKPYLPKTIGTAGDGHDELRGWLCADWLVRTFTPAWLELGGVTESAAALRALAPLRDLSSTQAARPAVDEAKSKARAARDAAGAAARAAAGAAARAAARDAAGAAARAAARDAAGAAAGAAARAAARDAAGAAARAAARDAAGAAAWAAAWDAAWAAAWAAARAAAWAAARAAAWAAAWAAAGDAAWAAAWDAARDELEPTKVGLQASALELLDTLTDPTQALAEAA